MYKRIISAALLFGMAALAPPAVAATCAPRDAVVERLSTRYSETVTARGLQNAEALIEIFTSPETGSFTILLSRPDGISCIVSAGSHWLATKPGPAGVAG